MIPLCIGCDKHPVDLAEYRNATEADGGNPDSEDVNDFVRREEGTYNSANGHFACTPCYVKLGQPSGPGRRRWIAP